MTVHLLSAAYLTPGRVWSLIAALVGVIGVVAGGLAVARSRSGDTRRGAVVALAAGLLGMAGGVYVVAAAKGGPGTGYGIVGGFLALVVGLIAAALGGVALSRSRRAGKVSGEVA
ncbi:DUF6223 family protein [Amycolatopsis japonica]